MGFAGQLSLGHALYLGLGAYTATALWTLFGIGPWLGVFIAIPVAAAAGLFIGWLGWRFAIEGVYFALLTIAFAEFTRIGFDHMADHRRRRRTVLAGQRRGRWQMVESRRRTAVLLLSVARACCRRHDLGRAAAPIAARLSLARRARRPAGSASASASTCSAPG